MGSFLAAIKGEDHGWGHFRPQLKERIIVGLFPGRNYKGAYGGKYFKTAAIRVTRSENFFIKRGNINGVCE